jgi:hypothetical protein
MLRREYGGRTRLPLVQSVRFESFVHAAPNNNVRAAPAGAARTREPLGSGGYGVVAVYVSTAWYMSPEVLGASPNCRFR